MSWFDLSHVTDVGMEFSAGPAVGNMELLQQTLRQQFRVDSARALDEELRNRWMESLRAAQIPNSEAADPFDPYAYRAFAQHVLGQPIDTFDPNKPLFGDYDPTTRIQGMIEANERIRALNDPNIRTFDQILEEVAVMQRGVEEETASMRERSSGVGAFFADLAGGIIGSFTTRDPLNLLTMPLGAGRTIATKALTDAAIAGGVTAVTEFTDVAPNRALVGLPERDPYENILYSALGAGIIRGGIEGVGYGVRRLRGGDVEDIDFDLRDAQMQQMFEANTHSPTARAGAQALNDMLFIERNNPYGEGQSANVRFIAELQQVQRLMGGEPATAVARFLPPLPFEYIQKEANFQLVREQAPIIYARMEVAQKRVDMLNAQIEQRAAVRDLSAQFETIQSRPGVNAGRMAKMLGPQLYGDISDIGPVAIKEVLQNSFDAIKTSQLRGLGKGNIDIKTRADTREIEITDNGVGMTPETLGTKFLEIAGTGKEEGASSGGFGIAKMLFLYGNDDLHVISMRDGRVSEMITKGDELFRALEDPSKAPPIEVRDPTSEDLEMFPDGSGTRVVMKIPETFKDSKTGEDLEIHFPKYEWEVPSLTRSPLFADIDVRFNDYPVGIGSAFPIEDFVPFSNIDFGWGNARIYVTREATKGYGDNVHILSNGIHQFSKKMTKEPMNPYSERIPYEFYIDINSKVSPEEPGYPFNFNRQSFTDRANKDFSKILGYINALYAFDDLAKGAESFGNARYFDEETGQLGEPISLQPTIKVQNKFANTIKPGDEMFVRDGRLYVNGRELPELKESDLKEGLPKAEELKVDPELIDPDKVMVHDNMLVTNLNGEKVPFYDIMRLEFGENLDDFLYSIGNTFRAIRDRVVRILEYDDLGKEAIGVSFDPEYRGVSIRVPFSGSFINPFLPESAANIAEAGYGLFGTMIHELAHHKVRSHNERFPQEMQRIWYKLQANTDDFLELQDDLIGALEKNQEVFNRGKEILEGNNVESAGNRLGGVNEDPNARAGDERLFEGADRGGEERVGPGGIPSEAQRGAGVAPTRREFGSDAFGPEADAALRDQLRIANREYEKAYKAVEAEAERLASARRAEEAAQQQQSVHIFADATYGRPFNWSLLQHDFVAARVDAINAFTDTLDEKAAAAFVRQLEGEEGLGRETWLTEDGMVDIGLKQPVDPEFRITTDDGDISVADAMRDLQDDADLDDAMRSCLL